MVAQFSCLIHSLLKLTDVKKKLSPSELINLISQKSRKGTETLYDHYAAALLAILRIVPQKDKVEIILEKTYVWIWLNIDLYDEREKTLLDWMMAVARNYAYELQESEVLKVNIDIGCQQYIERLQIPPSPPSFI